MTFDADFTRQEFFRNPAGPSLVDAGNRADDRR